MPQVDVDGLRINYDVQGAGEPLVLVPYLAADHACYAFQLPAYTEHFSCISVDLPGSGARIMPSDSRVGARLSREDRRREPLGRHNAEVGTIVDPWSAGPRSRLQRRGAQLPERRVDVAVDQPCSCRRDEHRWGARRRVKPAIERTKARTWPP
jgi:hypothetical protein